MMIMCARSRQIGEFQGFRNNSSPLANKKESNLGDLVHNGMHNNLE
jgi:hypothetical protein